MSTRRMAVPPTPVAFRELSVGDRFLFGDRAFDKHDASSAYDENGAKHGFLDDDLVEKTASARDLKPRGVKPPMSLLPYRPLRAVASALHDGAAKYGPKNYREQGSTSDWRQAYSDALCRHVLAFTDGEDRAQDSGVHHLAHAAACCIILLDLLGEDYVESTAVLEAKKTNALGFK